MVAWDDQNPWNILQHWRGIKPKLNKQKVNILHTHIHTNQSQTNKQPMFFWKADPYTKVQRISEKKANSPGHRIGCLGNPLRKRRQWPPCQRMSLLYKAFIKCIMIMQIQLDKGYPARLLLSQRRQSSTLSPVQCIILLCQKKLHYWRICQSHWSQRDQWRTS